MGKSKSKEKKLKKKSGEDTERQQAETQMITTNLTDRRLTFGVDESKQIKNKSSMKKLTSLETAENIIDHDDQNLSKQNILKKLEELDNQIHWQLFDAQESANIYTDNAQLDEELIKDQKKKIPKNSYELEIYQVIEIIRSIEKQIDSSKIYMLSDQLKMSFLVVAIVFLVCNDLLEFIDNFTGRIIAKVVIAAIIISITIFLMFYGQKQISSLQNQLNQEKKRKKNILQSFSNFRTKITSFIKVSPIQFAKILCNENLMNEFRTHKKGDRNGLNNIQIQDQIKLNSPEKKSSVVFDSAKYLMGEFQGGEMVEDVFVLQRAEITFFMFFDQEKSRYVICERFNKIEKYYILSLNMQSKKKYEVYDICYYVISQAQKIQFQRGQRGVNVDIKEFMALRNIVQRNCHQSDQDLVNLQRFVDQQEENFFNHKQPLDGDNPVSLSQFSKHQSKIGKGKLQDDLVSKYSQNSRRPRPFTQVVEPPKKKVYVDDYSVPEQIFSIEKVIDWDKRIEDYPNVKKQIYQTVFQKVKEFKQILSDKSGDWQVTINDTKQGERLFCEQSTSERGFAVIRTSSDSDFDVLTTFRAYINSDNRKIYDKNVKECEVIEHLGVNLFFGYQCTHRVSFVSSRDFYQLAWYNMEPDGSIIMVCFEDLNPNLLPRENCVRMRLPIAGLIFSPKKKDNTKTEISMVVEADLGGSVPGWVFKQLIGDTAKGLIELNKLIPKYIQKYKKELKEPVNEQQNDLA